MEASQQDNADWYQQSVVTIMSEYRDMRQVLTFVVSRL